MQATRSARPFAAVLVGGMVLLASACGSDGGASAPSTAAATTAPDTTAVDTTAPATSAVETTGAETSAVTDTTMIDATGRRPADAIAFDDPQGLYSIDIAPNWVDSSGTLGPEVEFFTIQPTGESFANNVNIMNQQADGRDLDAYMAYSIDNMGSLVVLDSGKIIGVNGNTLGYIEYSGKMDATGDQLMHFLAIISVAGDNVALLTMAATDDTFGDAADANLVYLLGLQAL